jgi:hypothetical protein
VAGHESFWIATIDAQPFPPLTHDIHVDVAIVGGDRGRHGRDVPKRSGQSVAILEAGRVRPRRDRPHHRERSPHCRR